MVSGIYKIQPQRAYINKDYFTEIFNNIYLVFKTPEDQVVSGISQNANNEPQWNETEKLFIQNKDTIQIIVEIYDYEVSNGILLGFQKIDLENLQNQNSANLSINLLQSQNNIVNQLKTKQLDNNQFIGQLFVSIEPTQNQQKKSIQSDFVTLNSPLKDKKIQSERQIPKLDSPQKITKSLQKQSSHKKQLLNNKILEYQSSNKIEDEKQQPQGNQNIKNIENLTSIDQKGQESKNESVENNKDKCKDTVNQEQNQKDLKQNNKNIIQNSQNSQNNNNEASQQKKQNKKEIKQYSNVNLNVNNDLTTPRLTKHSSSQNTSYQKNQQQLSQQFSKQGQPIYQQQTFYNNYNGIHNNSTQQQNIYNQSQIVYQPRNNNSISNIQNYNPIINDKQQQFQNTQNMQNTQGQVVINRGGSNSQIYQSPIVYQNQIQSNNTHNNYNQVNAFQPHNNNSNAKMPQSYTNPSIINTTFTSQNSNSAYKQSNHSLSRQMTVGSNNNSSRVQAYPGIQNGGVVQKIAYAQPHIISQSYLPGVGQTSNYINRF